MKKNNSIIFTNNNDISDISFNYNDDETISEISDEENDLIFNNLNNKQKTNISKDVQLSILVTVLLELLFKNNKNKLNNEYNMDINVKQMTLILQFACYNYNNDHNNNNIRNYKRIYKFKKSIEDEFDVLSNNNFYKDFFTKLNPIFIFSKKKFILLVNDLFSACPEQRSTKYLKKKIDNFE